MHTCIHAHQLTYKYKISKIVKQFANVNLRMYTFSSAPVRPVLVLSQRYGGPNELNVCFSYIFLCMFYMETK